MGFLQNRSNGNAEHGAKTYKWRMVIAYDGTKFSGIPNFAIFWGLGFPINWRIFFFSFSNCIHLNYFCLTFYLCPPLFLKNKKKKKIVGSIVFNVINSS